MFFFGPNDNFSSLTFISIEKWHEQQICLVLSELDLLDEKNWQILQDEFLGTSIKMKTQNLQQLYMGGLMALKPSDYTTYIEKL